MSLQTMTQMCFGLVRPSASMSKTTLNRSASKLSYEARACNTDAYHLYTTSESQQKLSRLQSRCISRCFSAKEFLQTVVVPFSLNGIVSWHLPVSLRVTL